MAERKKDFLSVLESRWALQLGALPVIGAVLGGLAASFTAEMSRFAPLSWFLAAIVGALAFQVFAWLRAAWAERSAARRRIELLATPKGQVNPLADVFQTQRIFVSDLAPPTGNLIKNKRFVGCELVGPTNVVFLGSSPGATSLTGCELVDCDIVIARDDATMLNALGFADCHFIDCHLYKFTLFMPLEIYKKHAALAGGNLVSLGG